jgi:flagellar biosynthetic protein FlhB
MAENQDKSSQTHEPTEKKISDARKKGDVPSSRESGNLMVVVSLVLIVLFVLPWQTSVLVGVLSEMVDMAGRIPVGTGQPAVVKLGQIMWDFSVNLSVSLAPVLLVLFGGAVFGVLIRGETVIAVDRIQPKLSKISPIEGLKRLFSADTMVEFIKNLTKVLVVGALAIWVTNSAVRDIWEAPGFLPENLPDYMAITSGRLLAATAAFLLPVTVVDILWRRFDWRRKQMMTMKDIRDEIKDSEGSPEIKGHRAALRRRRSKQRLATVVPMASVILTNPTHLAIALKYDPDGEDAPVCVAKGADNMARRIRKIAHENDVPIIENKPLARVLFNIIEVDCVVPVEHWQVVAEIIGFVIDLQNNNQRDLPTGSILRTKPD